MVLLQQNFYRGKNMTIRVQGALHCSDMRDMANVFVGRGNASVQWVMFHSPDGSNTNGRIIHKVLRRSLKLLGSNA